MTSAAITGVTDFAGDLATHKRPGWSDLGDVAFNAVTAGVGEYLPGVPGRLPYIFSNAFFTGSHTQNAFAQNLAGASIQLAIANAAPHAIGLMSSIIIEYVDLAGKTRTARLPSFTTFGRKKTAETIRILLHHNPSIKLDPTITQRL